MVSISLTVLRVHGATRVEIPPTRTNIISWVQRALQRDERYHLQIIAILDQ